MFFTVKNTQRGNEEAKAVKDVKISLKNDYRKCVSEWKVSVFSSL